MVITKNPAKADPTRHHDILVSSDFVEACLGKHAGLLSLSSTGT